MLKIENKMQTNELMEVQTLLSLYVKQEIQCNFDGLNHFIVPAAGVNANNKMGLEGGFR